MSIKTSNEPEQKRGARFWIIWVILMLIGGALLYFSFLESSWSGVMCFLIWIVFGLFYLSRTFADIVSPTNTEAEKEQTLIYPVFLVVVGILLGGFGVAVSLDANDPTPYLEILLAFGGLVFVASGLLKFINRSLGRRIQARSENSSPTAREWVAEEEIPSVATSTAPIPPFSTTVLDADTLPPPSDEANQYLERARSRFMEAAAIYHRILWLAFLASLFVAAIAALVLERWPVPKWIYFLLLLGTLWTSIALRPGKKIRASVTISQPMLFSLAWTGCILYVAIYSALVAAMKIIGGETPWYAAGAALVSVIAILAVIWWFRLGKRKTAALQRKLQADEPTPKLLFLWVFDTEGAKSLMLYAGTLWRMTGPMQFLRGKGYMVENSFAAIFQYLTGRKQFVETPDELAARLAEFSDEPHPMGGYQQRTVLCHDGVWRQALDTFLRNSDSVLMNLCGFTERNRGCAYELGQLIDRIPTGKFLLLVDQTTDMEFLLQLLRQEWETMSPNSPNRSPAARPIRFYRVQEKEAESDNRQIDLSRAVETA